MLTPCKRLFAGKRVKLSYEQEAGEGGDADGASAAPPRATSGSQPVRQFRGQRVDTPSHPGESNM
jgi:hypothetical protein